MGRRSRELVCAIGPGAGNPTPVRAGSRVCSVCQRPILPGQPALFGRHRICLTLVSDDRDATTYRTPEGGTIRLGKRHGKNRSKAARPAAPPAATS